MTAAQFFLRQWKARICFSTAFWSDRVGTFFGCSSSASSTTSLNATVMPPPVKGWRMFKASPAITRPGVLFVAGGRKELGMERSLPARIAASKEGWTHLGREGRTTFSRWFLTPPFLTEAEGRPSGISIRARVSCEPIW